jgi:hypothetical protein
LLSIVSILPTIPAEIMRRLNSAKAGEKWVTLLSAVITLIFTFVVAQIDLPVVLKIIFISAFVAAFIIALWQAAERMIIESLKINSHDLNSPQRLWVSIVVLSLILITSLIILFVERFDPGLMFGFGVAGVEVSSLLLAGCFGAMAYYYSAIPEIVAKYETAIRTYARSKVETNLRLRDVRELEAHQATTPLLGLTSLDPQQPPDDQVN